MVPLRAIIQLSFSLQPIFFFPFLPCSAIRSTRSTVAVLLLLAPHPSILHVLLNYHYLTLRAPLYFVAHLLIIYAFSFLAFSSLIACVARDPGPVPDPKLEDVSGGSGGGGGGDGEEISIEDALLSTAPPLDDYTQPGKWCRICWRPKPERTHHCSQCGRCVLKMGACPLVVY
jgi:palmitoyltransferase ZDHHC2/15/20